MASLYRLDVIIRGNSTITLDDAVKWTKKWVNDRQEKDSNKDEKGDYLKDYYADLYDSRSNNSFKIFSNEASKNREIKNEYKTENDKIIKGVIFTSPLNNVVEQLLIRISFLEAQIKTDNDTKQNNSEVKILV